MLNTLAYYLGYGASSAEEQEIQQSLHQEEDVSVDQFKISELKEENGWDLIEKKGQLNIYINKNKLKYKQNWWNLI